MRAARSSLCRALKAYEPRLNKGCPGGPSGVRTLETVSVHGGRGQKPQRFQEVVTMRDFTPYFRSTVGFDHLFNMLDQVADAGNGYPPYNIERTDETHYRISVAVAGFGDKDLTVEVKDGVLSVVGKREEAAKQSYLHQGIAGRAFERRFQLA